MDENLSWKIVYISTIFLLIVLGFAYYLISPRESPFFTEEKMEKIAEFKNARISGRKKGKKVWVFFAKEGWTTKDREITYLNKVSKGSIYMDGKLVVSQLTAPRAKAYRRSDRVEAFGPLQAYLELGKMSKPKSKDQTEWTRMTAKYLKYIPKEKRSEMKEDVVLHKKESTIYAQEIKIDHEKKIADISGKIKLKRKDGNLRADRMQYFSNEEKLEADGNVDLNIFEGKVETKLKAKHASFFTDISKDMAISGGLEVVQAKKLAIGQNGIYSQKKKELLIKGKAKAIFEKARIILKEETVQNLKNPEAKKILKEKTILTSDKLILSTRSGDAKASGSVFVTQKGREAKSEQALYDEKKETLTLFGKVYMKKGKDWVSAKKVVVSVKDETFEAFGAVEAEFKL
ncbi:MAG: LptA/OstA family protein [Candidatus Margulisiibacteriota bacterium]